MTTTDNLQHMNLLLNEITRNVGASAFVSEKYPGSRDALENIHEELRSRIEEQPRSQASEAEQVAFSEMVGRSKFIERAVLETALLAAAHPLKNDRDNLIDEDREALMSHLVEHNPGWALDYHAALGDNHRMEKRQMAMAIGGYDALDWPAESTLVNTGQIIDALKELPDESSRIKANILARAYQDFEATHAFNPSGAGASNEDHGQASPDKMASMNALARQALDLSKPEADAFGAFGRFLQDRCVELEVGLRRRDIGAYEQWQNRDTLSVTAVSAPMVDSRERYFSSNGLSTSIEGESFAEQQGSFAAATPLDSAMPMHATFDSPTGALLVTQHGGSDGMKAALEEDHADKTLRADVHGPLGSMQELKQELCDFIAKCLRYAESPDVENLADIMTGDLDPETIPEVEDWVRDCYSRPSDNELVMYAANALLYGHGTEFIRADDIGDGSGSGFEYVNQGESYTPTFIQHEGSLYLTSWADMVEALEQEQANDRDSIDWDEMPINNPNPMPDATIGDILDKMAALESAPVYPKPDEMAM